MPKFMSRRNATFWSQVGETGVGEQVPICKRRCMEWFTHAMREFWCASKSDSAVVEWICWPWSKYRSNKHLTRSKHKWQATTESESTNSLCVILGTHYCVYIVTLLLSFWSHRFDSYRIVRQCKGGLKGGNPLLHQIVLLRTFCPKGITTNQLKRLCSWQFSSCGLS